MNAKPQEPSMDVSLRLIKAQDGLRGFILALTMDVAATEEILSTANARILERAADYDDARPFEPWARSLAWWEIRRWRTERQRESRVLTIDSDLVARLGEEYGQVSDGESLAVTAVTDCMARATAANRELLSLRYVDGRPVEEIAAARNLSPTAVYQHLARARHALRDCVMRLMCQWQQKGARA